MLAAESRAAQNDYDDIESAAAHLHGMLEVTGILDDHVSGRLTMDQVRPGIYHWTGPDTEVCAPVHSHYVEPAGVLVDPCRRTA